jgi:protein-S-isoprenylcysteine O-methyltransferase Ste14
MNEFENNEIVEKLKKINDKKRKRTLIGACLITAFLLCFVVSFLIFLDLIGLSFVIGLIVLAIGVISFGAGIYLLYAPMVSSDEDEY